MSDIEMIELCRISIESTRYIDCDYCEEHAKEYNPLRFDEQAMALAKKFAIDMAHSRILGEWHVICCDENSIVKSQGANADLNRAIVECVAKMKVSKR